VPILVVPHDAAPVQWTDGQPVDVLLALDGSAFAEAAIAALGLAHALGGLLRLLRVSDHAGPASANDYLAKLAGTLEMSRPPVHRQVVVGPSVSAAILNEVRDNHVGALVMATHGRTGVLRAVLSRVGAETGARRPRGCGRARTTRAVSAPPGVHDARARQPTRRTALRSDQAVRLELSDRLVPSPAPDVRPGEVAERFSGPPAVPIMPLLGRLLGD
jgi:nucleotide-binding universal stress UspA family protein